MISRIEFAWMSQDVYQDDSFHLALLNLAQKPTVTFEQGFFSALQAGLNQSNQIGQNDINLKTLRPGKLIKLQEFASDNPALKLRNFGWKRVMQKAVLATGNQMWINNMANFYDDFYACLYYNIRFGGVVVAYRGTVITDWDTDKADYKLWRNQKYSQDEQAILYYINAQSYLGTNHPQCKIRPFTTGHSLGGYLAAIVAEKMHTTAYTFNAPNITQTILNRLAIQNPHGHIYATDIGNDVIHKVNEGPDEIHPDAVYILPSDPIPEWVTSQEQFYKTHYLGAIIDDRTSASLATNEFVAKLYMLGYYYKEHKISNILSKLVEKT